jgi:hypothetical protein
MINVPRTNAGDANLWNIFEGPFVPTARETPLSAGGLYACSIVNDK